MTIPGRFLGLDVGGTKVATGLLDEGRLIDQGVEPVARHSTGELVDQIARIVDSHRDAGVQAVGLGVPSVVEFETGRIRYTVNLPLRDVPLRTLLEQRTGVPVFVENDASCAALAEAFEDGELVCQHLVMITVGTGLGGGLVLNGRLYRGATGAAPELGHIIMGLDLTDGAPADPGPFPQPGSFERLASGRALDRLATEAARAAPQSPLGRRLAADGEVTGHDAVELAREGDPVARDTVRILGERLGIGIATTINLFDPQEVVVGGGVSAAGDLLMEPARRTAARHTLPGVGTRTSIRLARHGVAAGVLGAALIAAQEHVGVTA